MTINRRQYFRLRLEPSVSCFLQMQGGGVASNAVIIDLGGHGCQVRTLSDFPGSVKQGSIRFEFGQQTWDFTCRIAWKRRGLSHCFYGIEFVAMPQAAAGRLMRTLFDQERSKIRR